MAGATGRQAVTRRAMLGTLGTALLAPGAVGAASDASDDRALLTAANTQFALDLYGRLGRSAGNVFFSPFSVSTALAMTWAGARGATAEEMTRTLRFRSDPAAIHAAYARLTREVNGDGQRRASALASANALWARRGGAFEPDFLRLGRDGYGAALEELDFRAAPETARRTINEWVARRTNDRIKDLLPEGTVTADTGMILTNAIYFKGEWQLVFDREGTAPAPFTRADGGTVANVPMMRQRERMGYLDGGAFQAVELLYDARETSMVVFLPRRPDGLPELERSFTAARLAEWLAAIETRGVDLTLPRFTLTQTAQLVPLLREPGWCWRSRGNARTSRACCVSGPGCRPSRTRPSSRSTSVGPRPPLPRVPSCGCCPPSRGTRLCAPTTRSSSSSATAGPVRSSLPVA